MLLSRDDADLFFRLHRSLMHFVNHRLGVVPEAKERQGIVTSFPVEAIPITAAKSTKPRKPKKSSKKATSSVADSPPGRVYQFKITLKGIRPPIWRRIHVRDCTLIELHEHIQTAMGWTNSHLHQFEIDGQRYGDPELLTTVTWTSSVSIPP